MKVENLLMLWLEELTAKAKVDLSSDPNVDQNIYAMSLLGMCHLVCDMKSTDKVFLNSRKSVEKLKIGIHKSLLKELNDACKEFDKKEKKDANK